MIVESPQKQSREEGKMPPSSDPEKSRALLGIGRESVIAVTDAIFFHLSKTMFGCAAERAGSIND